MESLLYLAVFLADAAAAALPEQNNATWDVTVAHTLATSYVSQNALQTGSAAAAASVRKTTNYSTLSASQMFFFRWR